MTITFKMCAKNTDEEQNHNLNFNKVQLKRTASHIIVYNK